MTARGDPDPPRTAGGQLPKHPALWPDPGARRPPLSPLGRGPGLAEVSCHLVSHLARGAELGPGSGRTWGRARGRPLSPGRCLPPARRSPPSDLTLASESPNSLRVSWTPPSGPVLHYRLTYALASGSGPEKSVGVERGGRGPSCPRVPGAGGRQPP